MATVSEENLAAVLSSSKGPLEIQTLPIPTPGPGEILIRTSLISLNAIEAKIALLAPFPVPCTSLCTNGFVREIYTDLVHQREDPTVLGFSFSGTIEAVGDGREEEGWKVGEKVLVSKRFGTQGNEYGAYQRYVLVAAGEKLIARIPNIDGGDEEVLVGMLMNAVSVPGLFSGRLGLRHSPPSSTGDNKKILIYGGTSSIGRLSIQYLSHAGYSVTTTTSPKHHDQIKNLGAEVVIDHTSPADEIIEELVASGPYDVVADMISFTSTISITAKILQAQGGGKIYAMQPAFGEGEHLPDGVERAFEPWPESLYKDGNENLLQWVVNEYLPHGVLRGWITAQPVEKVEGGLRGIGAVLERVLKGNGGRRCVVDAWE
jgi:NADPH:quinone reductase-like Zn-dependent oxidoreductase